MLSALCWAVINVGNSVIVARFTKSPWVINWTQTFFSTVMLAVIACFVDVRTPWIPVLIPVAIVAYAGDVFFLWVLDRLDISVVNAAWAVLAMFMSAAGFLLFNESWTSMQAVGAGFVLIGVLLISFFNARRDLCKTLLMLTTLAALYVPDYVARKAALNAGEQLLPLVFWLIAGRDVTAFVWPALIPNRRRMLISQIPWNRPGFFGLSLCVILAFYMAEYFLASAYAVGPVSLISVTGNIQPFFVIFLSWIVARTLPAFAPREKFSVRVTGMRLASFLIVFFGLALLGQGL